MKNNHKSAPFNKKWLFTLAVCTTCMLAVAPSAFAGKEGVFVSADTYFTLEDASFTAGNDSTSLQFALKMHNGSSEDIDFNSYGVRIVDAEGNPFSAQLTSKQNARVTPGKDSDFRFFSKMAIGETPEELKVNVFAWDETEPTFMRSIGDLSVYSAVSSLYDASKQILIPMNDLDASYSKEVQVAMRLGRSYQIAENGSSYMYTELYTQNTDKVNLSLPSNLQFRLIGTDSLQYVGALLEGNQQPLQPGKLTKLTLRTLVPDSFLIAKSRIEAFHVESAEDRILGALSISETELRMPIGQEQPYSMLGSDNGIRVMAERAIAVKQTEGILLQTTVKIRNDSATATTLPAFTAAYQFGTGSVEASQEQSVRTGFLSPHQTATVQYSVLLPDGIDPKTVDLVLFEPVSGTNTGASATNNTSNSSANSAGTSSNSGSIANGTAGSATNGANGNASSTGSTGSTGNTSSNGGSASNSSNSGNAGNTTNNSANSNNDASSNTASSSNSIASGSASSASNSSNGSTSSSNTTNNSNTANRNTSGKRPIMLIDLSTVEFASHAAIQSKSYELGTPLSFVSNGWLDTNIEVSLVELHMHENSDFGYKTAVAKYKLTNRGSSTLNLPALGTELINNQGLAFAGIRQSSTASQIMPNTSYVVSYSYLLPTSETGAQLALNVFDPKSTASNKLSIGTYQVAIQPESTDKTISFYPFQISFDAYAITTLYSSNAYNYILSLDLSVSRQDLVIVDQNFSQLEFEIIDGLGRSLGSQTAAFTGTQKLISGNQKITFSNIKTQQFETGLTIHVYETITTPNGPAKRLVKLLTQE
ncbi:hypothetical protein [Paenibacillus agricola]|uniref:Uncharacterized protein n=1 Tax=Paenibacillus agricola TaxID=2716264 RepID=A0ABX0J2Q7_9BACL|nr:hypothetical protein [Paenibacillus agricola]NHN29098.1 hypothetical protein [Paenibacillus agricola]